MSWLTVTNISTVNYRQYKGGFFFPSDQSIYIATKANANLAPSQTPNKQIKIKIH